MARRELKNEIKYKITLDEDQKKVKESIFNNQIVVITGRAGCLAYGTKIIMYDGSVKEVQDIVVGDQLMGVDSTHRTVLSLARGKQQMYKIVQNKGISYIVNEDHILSLINNIPAKYRRKTLNGKRVFDYNSVPLSEKKSEVLNISVKNYLKLNKKLIKQTKGYISDTVQFPEKPLPIDPYYLGLWLGDGNKRSIRSITTNDIVIIKYLKSIGAEHSKSHKFEMLLPKGTYGTEFKKIYELNTVDGLDEKYIPKDYIINSKENRLKLLAGLIDSDGYYVNKGKYYEIGLKDKILLENITYICRSLGFKTNFRERLSKMTRTDGSIYQCTTYRLSIILTNDLEIPIKIERKKHEKGSNFKNKKLTGIKVEKLNVDDYYGFELDGDGLFLLEDFTVTHNSGKSLVTAQTSLDMLFKKEVSKIYITRANVVTGRDMGFLPGDIDDKLNPYLEAFKENLYSCYDKEKIDKHIQSKEIDGTPLAYIRGKTIQDVLVVEEAQNMTKHEILAILTRLGKNGRIIINGDVEQSDIKETYTGLHYVIDLSKKIDGIEYFKLKNNHRSDLVGKILDYEYAGNNLKDKQ